jgi:hypothetical protein
MGRERLASCSSVWASPATIRTMKGSLTAGMSNASSFDESEKTEIWTSRQAGPCLRVSVSPRG